MSEKMEFRAHDIVLEYIQRHLDKSDDVPNIEIYTVWKCKILQNWKFLISSSLLDGMYYELTFNGDKNEWYLDAYKKFENQVIREDTVNAPQTKRYDYSKSVMENIKCGNGITREIPQNEKEQPIKIGDEVYVHGYIDEIRQDIVIIRNNGGYFGTFSSEVVDQEPCEDLISRQAAIEALDKRFDNVPMEQTAEILKLRKDLRELPSIQSEQKRGRWIYGEDEYGIDGYHCDKCGFFVPWDYTHKFINYIEDYNFCPSCGADMRGEQDE